MRYTHLRAEGLVERLGQFAQKDYGRGMQLRTPPLSQHSQLIYLHQAIMYIFIETLPAAFVRH